MHNLEPKFKAAGIFGAIVFILYCLNISFLPSEVSLGDIIPLVLLFAQFVLSLAWYALLFALTGAFFWFVARVIYSVITLPLRLARYLILISLSALRMQQGAALKGATRSLSVSFPVRANPFLAVVGLYAFALLLSQYLRHGFGVSIPSILQGFLIQVTIFSCGCMFLFVALQHFFSMYAPLPLRRQVIITSPIFRLAPHAFLTHPEKVNIQLAAMAIVVLLFCFPGGYTGLLALCFDSGCIGQCCKALHVSQKHGTRKSAGAALRSPQGCRGRC